VSSFQIGAIAIFTLFVVAALVTVIVWFIGDAAEHVTLLLAQFAPLGTDA
jgi:hypothetical protein